MKRQVLVSHWVKSNSVNTYHACFSHGNRFKLCRNHDRADDDHNQYGRSQFIAAHFIRESHRHLSGNVFRICFCGIARIRRCQLHVLGRPSEEEAEEKQKWTQNCRYGSTKSQTLIETNGYFLFSFIPKLPFDRMDVVRRLRTSSSYKTSHWVRSHRCVTDTMQAHLLAPIRPQHRPQWSNWILRNFRQAFESHATMVVRIVVRLVLDIAAAVNHMRASWVPPTITSHPNDREWCTRFDGVPTCSKIHYRRSKMWTSLINIVELFFQLVFWHSMRAIGFFTR